MFYSQLQCNSPKNRFRQITGQISEPFYHLTLKKLNKLEIYYDDVVINKKKVGKIILIGKIIEFQKGTSPRGMAIITIKIQDGTDTNELFFYYSSLIAQKIQIAHKNHLYVKMAAQVKVTGLIYRPNIQLSGISMKIIQNFNEITSHFLSCCKSETILYK